MSGATNSGPDGAASEDGGHVAAAGEFPFVETPGRAGLGPVRRFAEIDSTNRYLADAARAGAAPLLVAVAAHQTAGRGRLGRRWEAPPGANLLCSILLRPELPEAALHLCTVAVALAGADACAATAGLEAGLKWPNDLVVGDRKLAGVLAEALTMPDGGLAVVVGIGLNLGWPAARTDEAGAPEGLLAAATSVLAETGRAPSLDDVLDRLLDSLGERLASLGDADRRLALAGEHRRRCVTVGRRVRVELPDETFTGVAADVTVEGHLLVDVGACLRTVTAGDVVHLRSTT